MSGFGPTKINKWFCAILSLICAFAMHGTSHIPFHPSPLSFISEKCEIFSPLEHGGPEMIFFLLICIVIMEKITLNDRSYTMDISITINTRVIAQKNIIFSN